MATAGNAPRSKRARGAVVLRAKRDKFAARLAAIVFRWRTVHMQQPESPASSLWMSSTKRSNSKSARA